MSARVRGSRLLAALLLGAIAGCTGPKIPAGNLKELREKKKELAEAQRKAGEAPAQPAPPPADAACHRRFVFMMARARTQDHWLYYAPRVPVPSIYGRLGSVSGSRSSRYPQ